MTSKAIPFLTGALASLFRPRAPQESQAPQPFDPETATALGEFNDPGAAISFGYIVIAVGFIAVLVWSIFAPIGEGVPAQGLVVVESHRKIVSHLTGGTVAKVAVRENQNVKEGDVLIMLDSSRAQTALDTLLHEHLAASAKLARLMAEQSFSSQIDFPEDIRLLAKDLARYDVLRGQEQLFKVRRQTLESEENILRETLSASHIQATGARQQLAARNQQASLLQQEITANRMLVEDGYAPRNRLLEQERQLAELTSSTSELQTRIAREGSTGSEIRLRLLQRRQEYLKEVETQTTETRRELAMLGERLKDARLELERTTVRAPVSGQVVGMQAQAAGSVITPGSKLLEVVPDGDRLLFDVQIPVNIINRVHAGLETDIRLTTFPNTPTLIIEGKVQSVSSDRFEPQGLQPYYLARVEVTPAGIAQLEGRQLRPGMTADVIIKTGERTFMAYLLAPITRQMFSAFREP